MKKIMRWWNAPAFLLAGLILNLGAGCVRNDAGLILTRDGAPMSTIVIAGDATRAAQFAAAELQYHIEKISGAQLPIVRDDADESKITGVRILVGESAFTRKLGLRNDDFAHQEYLMQFLPDTMVLMGRDKNDKTEFNYAAPQTFPGQFDEQATCYAVYDFLEHYCGVRWYLPTDTGMVCPETKTLAISGMDARRAPAMKYRRIYVGALIAEDLSDESKPCINGREGALFSARQRLTGVKPYACNHAFYGYYNRYFKEHREWFAKGYDKNMPEELRNKPSKEYYPNMCYTDEGFISNVVRRARSFFDTGIKEAGEQAAGDYFGLGPMDSTGTDKFCKCPECLALLEPTWKNPPCKEWRDYHFFWDDRASDYIFGFTSRVARELAKTHPDKYVTQIAYHQNYYPPTREPVAPNVAVQFCIHAQLRAVPAMDKAVTELLDKWDEAAPDNQKYLWLYFHRPGRANPFFPGFMARKMVTQMADYHRRGIQGIFAEPAYLSAPLDENGKQKPGYSRRAPNANLLEMYLAFKLAYDDTLDGNQLIDEFFPLFYGAAGPAMQELYEAIERVYCDPANYMFNPDYNGYQTPDIAWSRLGTAERMAEFGKLMTAAKAATKTRMEKKRVALFEKNIWERMQAGRAKYAGLEEQKADMQLKRANASRLAGSASEDGDPDKADWTQTPKSAIPGNFGTLDGKPTKRSLEGRLLHDGAFLYVQLQEMMNISELVVQGDDNIWNEDNWELFVGRERGYPYRQIGVNARGAHKALAYGEAGTEWNSGARVVSDTSNPDRWTVRLALPLKDLLPGGVEPGQTIYMNVCRGGGGRAENLSWSPTFTDGFHAPTQMGAVHLTENAGISMEQRTEGE